MVCYIEGSSCLSSAVDCKALCFRREKITGVFGFDVRQEVITPGDNFPGTPLFLNKKRLFFEGDIRN